VEILLRFNGGKVKSSEAECCCASLLFTAV
jgi:hypothetical protein